MGVGVTVQLVGAKVPGATGGGTSWPVRLVGAKVPGVTGGDSMGERLGMIGGGGGGSMAIWTG